MKKRLFATCFVVLLAFASSITAFAVDRQGTAGWEVTFDGKRMNTNFTAADMDRDIYNLLPGDSVELTITLKNNYNGQADWYMENTVLETLEKATDDSVLLASGGAYDYELTYTGKTGNTSTLFASEKFGGDGRKNGIGLEGATKTLDGYFFLERLGNGESGVIKLRVALEGETQGNDYQDTLARLQMNFATELVNTSGNPGSSRESVKTGDQTKILLYVVLTLVAGLVLLIVALFRLRNDREEAVAMVEDSNVKTRRRRRR